MRVKVVTHNPVWAAEAELEATQINSALGDVVLAIHHIGSTAIPGIYTKQILDFLLEVDDIQQLDQNISVMESLGYESMGEYGIPGRRYFRKSNVQGIRTHHVHAFEKDTEEVIKHLAFRDYMIAHPDHARAYSELKRSLAAAHPDDIQAYVDGKDPFIKKHLARAMSWHSSKRAKLTERDPSPRDNNA
jgi:GrpB-like predicted nucleotidyltransferase (UPF0157 family)